MWRRFIPKKKLHTPIVNDGMRLSTVRSLDDASRFIEQFKTEIIPEDNAAKQSYLLTLLLAQTPRAALAQVQMDKHKHGYRNREKRLYELIDFNDTLVSLVLATPHAQLFGLAERIRTEMVEFCRRLNTPMFSDEQYDAIIRGLSREIAVYRGALHQGFTARMTSRSEDAFGIDMVITDPATGAQLNIDCKTPPAFRHRMEELVVEERITDAELLKADEQSFLTLMRHRDTELIPVTLLCIRPDELGEVKDFVFVDGTQALGSMLRLILQQQSSLVS